jgi:hypothetical protein|nr:MAG TPA: hypothetical protein [Crassvirales sp.]
MKEIRSKMIVEDRTKVKAVHFKYPEMMNEGAQEEIKNDYNELLSLEEELYDAREVVRELEKKLTEKKKKFDEKTSLCTLEFETSEKDIVNYESYALLKGMGNDTLGHYNS